MKNRLFNIDRVAVVFLHDTYRAVMEHTRRRRLDALRHRTVTNDLWQITECPDFLNRHRQRPPELPGENIADAVVK